MATAKKTQIVITANAATAKKVMDELQQRIDALKQRMAALDVTTKQGQKDFKTLEKELVSYNSAVAQNISNTERIDKAMKNLSGTSLNELKRALSAAKSELGKMSASSAGLKQMQGNVKAIQNQIDQLTQSTKKQGSAWQIALKNLTAYVGMFAVFNKAKELMTGVIKKNLDYSSSLTDIRKVSGLAMTDVNKLSNELAKIDTRTSTEGLAELAYQGAKLGMGKYGVDGMAGFVRAADQINVAIGEEMGKEALPALSKMVETMGLIPKMGIEKAMLATGSAMFKLSSTSTSTSGNIVEFAKRLTGVSRTAGITTDQLLALGSASDSLFLMPEVSATAMSKFIVALQKNHNLIEKDLGIQQGTIKQMYAAGHAMDAIVLVLEKMRDKGNMNALGGIFKDLGSDGQRLVTAMVTMSKNVDVLKDHLYESQEAFEEATAVTSEYEMQQTSALGILERANNLWEKAFVNPEGVDNVKMLTQAWYDISQTLLQSPLYNGSLHAALSLVIQAAKTFVALLPLMINYLISAGIAKGISFIWQMVQAIRAAIVAQQGFNLATKGNPYVALASVILTVVGVLWSFVGASKEAADAEAEAEKKANAWKNRLNEAQQETDTLTKKLHAYKTALEQANLSQKDRETQIAKFNRDFRSYISKLEIEIKSVSDLKKHYSELAQEIQRATYYRLREQAKEDTLPSYQKDRLNAANRIKQALQIHKSATQLNGKTDVQNAENPGEDDVFTTKMIMEQFARGTSANELYRQIITSRYPGAKNIKVDKKTGKYTYTDAKGRSRMNTGDQFLLSSLRHYQNATARELAKTKEIDDYFSPFVPEDYTPWAEEEPGTLENDAPDKKAIAEAKRQRQEQQKAWREELKQLQDDAQAIMDDVRNFYERQINEKLSEAVSLGMDKTEQDLFVEPVKRRMSQALNNVRLAIAEQKNNWATFKSTMDKDLIEPTDATGVNLSVGLLNNIQGNDIAALSAKMRGLSANLGKPYNSTIAEIFAKATKNEQSNLKLEAQQKEARRKVAQENDYTGAVKQNIYDDFNTMGYANPTDAEVADKVAFDRRKANILAMYEKARTEIAQLYTIDVSNESGRGLLIKFLFGDDADGIGARISATLKEEAADWQTFYHKLIQYSDNYAEAQKKTYDQQKKISDQMWAVNKRNLARQKQIRDIQNESNLYGNHTNYWSNLGLANLTSDPEVELLKARMQAAEDYYAFIEKNYRNKQLLQEADTARQEAELAYANQMAMAMKSRLSQMKELVQPIETFGEAMGEALATMKYDAESANEEIKSALKSMLQSWGKMAINSVNTQMWKAINDAGAKRGVNNAKGDIDAARANANANVTTANISTIGTAGNPAHVIVDGGIPGTSDAANGAIGDATGNTGNATGDATGNTAGEGAAPARAWMKRDRDNAAGGANGVSGVPSGVGGATGAAVADAATGNGGLANVGANVLGEAGNALLNTPMIGGGGSAGSEGGSVGGSSKDEKAAAKQRKKEEKERKKQLKAERKHQKDLTRETKKGLKDREKETDKGIGNMSAVTEAGNEEQSKSTEIAQDAMMAATQTALTTNLAATQQNNDETLKSDAARTQGEVTFSIAGAMAKCFEFLGPIAGPIAASVVMATLMGLLQWALSSALGGSKSSSSSSSGTNTKLKTGMLTYDSGNVQDLKPFVGDNGEMYWATENNVPNSGVSLLSSPTATTINGQRSLVAENGPELVIGRETTKAMMMNNPALLKALVNYDSNYSGHSAARRTFDEGNVAEVSVANSAQMAGASTAQQTASDATNAALLQAVSALMARLEQPITAQISMFGRGQLYESMNKANQFMKGK
jgi:hypothetical protein